MKMENRGARAASGEPQGDLEIIHGLRVMVTQIEVVAV